MPGYSTDHNKKEHNTTQRIVHKIQQIERLGCWSCAIQYLLEAAERQVLDILTNQRYDQYAEPFEGDDFTALFDTHFVQGTIQEVHDNENDQIAWDQPNPNIPRIVNKSRPLTQRRPLARNFPRIGHTRPPIILIMYRIIELRHRIRYPSLTRKIPHKPRKQTKPLPQIITLIIKVREIIDIRIHLTDTHNQCQVGCRDDAHKQLRPKGTGILAGLLGLVRFGPETRQRGLCWGDCEWVGGGWRCGVVDYWRWKGLGCGNFVFWVYFA